MTIAKRSVVLVWSCALILASLVALTGCAGSKTTTAAGVTTPPAPIAGAANVFDSTTYQWLITAQAAIEQAKVGIPAAQIPLLNKVIADYNLVETAYATYHALATAGTATPAQQAALQSQIDNLKAEGAPLGVK